MIAGSDGLTGATGGVAQTGASGPTGKILNPKELEHAIAGSMNISLGGALLSHHRNLRIDDICM